MLISKMGVIGTSRKEDERRVPIHPEHLKRLPDNIRKHLIFEEGYGLPDTNLLAGGAKGKILLVFLGKYFICA